ncbi:hypothetical protein BOTBODRAFT_176673 [Botryobasidium botryosum FD-172 SS1]|uniref:glutathione transferase n=1 Tax=Botryobasidium botryosum (strain FD-172 SS1) TaxID=930990 RepID=A0A067M8P1_BOTB1|nr:hypothetical protein BOTBODRAFT_176673 [Botryobasidium botryosum FD-172 SS1]
MVLKIHGSSLSTCTRRFAVVAKELGVPYELTAVDFANAEHKSDAYIKKMHPFGRVPVAFDGDFRILESRAIARYIAAKHPEKSATLAPPSSNAEAYARLEEAASLEYSDFDPPASSLVYEKLFKKMKGLGEADEAFVASYTEKLKNVLAGYERLLGERKFLAGDNITIADLFHLPYGYTLEKIGVDWTSYGGPNVKRWWQEVSSRPSWQAVKDGA